MKKKCKMLLKIFGGLKETKKSETPNDFNHKSKPLKHLNAPLINNESKLECEEGRGEGGEDARKPPVMFHR